PDLGSCFHFILPLKLGNPPDLVPEQTKKAHITMNQFQGAKILLVEDNQINQELAEALLRRKGIEVTVAVNGREALKCLENNNFDGVLMDIQMPIMDGYTASRTIRKNPRYKDLPILALTANVMAGDRKKSREAGMNAHIGKPFREEEMFGTMARFIQPGACSRPEKKIQVAPTTPWYNLVGIDPDQGLENTMDDPDLYLKMLRLFSEDQGNFKQQFIEAQQGKDPDTPTRLAHTLKGLAATIGANDLQQIALQLEILCRQGATEKETARLFQRVVAELDRVIQGLEHFLAKRMDSP
ncbi:MAG: response regulator, partial [Candidatus Electrothrix sp. AR3]|nr:response regulator [Candidatus Electrothrix sp. AR3]